MKLFYDCVQPETLFNWVWKVIQNCFCSAVLRSDWFKKKQKKKKKTRTTNSTNQIENQNHRHLVARVFPPLTLVTCICFEFSLMHLLFTLVVIGPSINWSYTLDFFSCFFFYCRNLLQSMTCWSEFSWFFQTTVWDADWSILPRISLWMSLTDSVSVYLFFLLLFSPRGP